MFSCDYIEFYEEGKPFDPRSDESLTSISLDLSLSSDLNFESAKKIAEKAEKILWKLDFDLINLYPRALASYLLSIKEFTTEFLTLYEEKTFGVSLYAGPLLFPLKWNLEHEENFHDVEESEELEVPDEVFEEAFV